MQNMQTNMQNMSYKKTFQVYPKICKICIEYAKYVSQNVICRICTPHFADDRASEKNGQCPLPVLRRRRRGEAVPLGEAASWLYWKVNYAFLLISCLPRPVTRPCWLEEIQADTTHRPNSLASSWVGGRALIVKVMVWGVRRGIRAPAELGPGEMWDGGQAAEMQRDEGWNRSYHRTSIL
jgi:hypothetical protein